MYAHRKKYDDFLDVFVPVVLCFIICGVLYMAMKERSAPPPPRKMTEIKTLSAEEVGQQVGSSSAGFIKGFAEGFKDRSKK